MSTPSTPSFSFVRDLPSEKWRGTAKLWRISPPYAYSAEEGKPLFTDHVVTSAVNNPSFGGRLHETYIFPCDPDGKVLDWCELPGSEKQTTDHEAAIARFNTERDQESRQ